MIENWTLDQFVDAFGKMPSADAALEEALWRERALNNLHFSDPARALFLWEFNAYIAYASLLEKTQQERKPC